MNRPDPSFIAEIEMLEGVYLASRDPMKQSGYSGGRARWVAERSPLVDAIEGEGEFLDVGSANGLLAEDVVAWAAEKGHKVVPYGVDIGSGLIGLAKRRFPRHSANFVVADAWSWEPDRTWDFVYSLLDLAPDDLTCVLLDRLATWVTPGGRLIIGSYGSRSRVISPMDVSTSLEACGFAVTGSVTGGDPPLANFAWADL